MVKSHENKCQNYFRVTTITMNDTVKCRGQQEKMIDFDYCEEYLKVVYQTKYYYGSLRKAHSHSVLICRLIRKSII